MADADVDKVDALNNPCRHKACCRICRMVSTSNRPFGCVTLKCDQYKPCRRCGENKDLNDESLCSACNPNKRETPREIRKNVRDEIKAREEEETQDVLGSAGIREVSLTHPGKPPPELSKDESEFYMYRWQQYQGYYRDPAAYWTVHTMILEEIHQSIIQQQLAGSRGELNMAWLKAKETSIRMLKELKAQLPEKEASDLSDDAKSLAGIYESYITEKGLKSLGKVSRVLTSGALALAPVLPFKINVQKLLENLGYSTQSIDEACSKYDVELGRTPEEVLEKMGFSLKEKYALPYRHSNEDELSVGEGMSELDATLEAPLDAISLRSKPKVEDHDG